MRSGAANDSVGGLPTGSCRGVLQESLAGESFREILQEDLAEGFSQMKTESRRSYRPSPGRKRFENVSNGPEGLQTFQAASYLRDH